MTPLVTYILRGLRNCYMPEQKCWSFIYHLDGRTNPNESKPSHDVFYSLNVILGLAHLGREAWENDYDLPELLHHNAARMFDAKSPTYALGMALWASAELNEPLHAETLAKIRSVISTRSNWPHFRAQDAGMILSGLCAQKQSGNSQFDELTPEFHAFVVRHYRAETGLYFDHPTGLRRNYASFATQTYLTTALYHFAQAFENEQSGQMADESVKKLMSLQGPMGEWPWFYYPAKGIVIDPYEVYSVHQDGMAALFLNIAEQRGIAGARKANVKGFNWIFGNNQMKHNMLRPDLGMICRSIIRQGELKTNKRRMFRAIVNGFLGRPAPYIAPDKLDLRLECRSYHLGWVLYSYGRRDDLPDIQNHPDFIAANKKAVGPASA